MSLMMPRVIRSLPQAHSACFFSTISSSPFEKFGVRVKTYNHETFKLETLSSIRPLQEGGWSVECYDQSISNDVRDALRSATKTRGIKMFDEGKGSFRVEVVDPAQKALHSSWKQARKTQAKQPPLYQDNYLAESELDTTLLDPFTPKANSLRARLVKAWVPVDTKQAARRAARQHKQQQALENIAASAAEDLGYSDGLVKRVERLASSNKKAMRQLLKRATAASLEEPLKPVWT